METKTYWVPNGYYSKSKIKENDVEVIIVKEFEKQLRGNCNEAKGIQKFRFIDDSLKEFWKGYQKAIEDILGEE